MSDPAIALRGVSKVFPRRRPLGGGLRPPRGRRSCWRTSFP